MLILHENPFLFPKFEEFRALPTLSMQRGKQPTRNVATPTCRKQLRTEILANVRLESLENSLKTPENSLPRLEETSNR